MGRFIITLLLSVCSLHVGAQSDLRISFGTIEHNSKSPVTVNELLRDPRIISSSDSFKVISYQVMIKSNASDMLLGPYKVQGARITQEAIDALKANRKGGGTIHFDEIVVVGPDKQPRKCNSLIVRYSN